MQMMRLLLLLVVPLMASPKNKYIRMHFGFDLDAAPYYNSTHTAPFVRSITGKLNKQTVKSFNWGIQVKLVQLVDERSNENVDRSLADYFKRLRDGYMKDSVYDYFMLISASELFGSDTGYFGHWDGCGNNSFSLISNGKSKSNPGEGFSDTEISIAMMKAFLYKFGITDRSSCTCSGSDCIFGDPGKIRPPDCALGIITASKANCLDRPVNAAESALSYCGNGLLEKGEECECRIVDKKCKIKKTCNKETCTNIATPLPASTTTTKVTTTVPVVPTQPSVGSTTPTKAPVPIDPSAGSTTKDPNPKDPEPSVSATLKWILIGGIVVIGAVLLVVLFCVLKKKGFFHSSLSLTGSSTRSSGVKKKKKKGAKSSSSSTSLPVQRSRSRSSKDTLFKPGETTKFFV